MAKIYSTLAVEKDSTADIVDFLRSKLRLVFQDDKSYALGIHLSVDEAPKEWLHGSPTFDELAHEEDRFYREFDVSSFKVSVDLFCARESPMADCIHVIADGLGRIISQGMKTRVLVFFDGTHVPYCLYASGERKQEFPTHYTEYVKRRPWVLRGISDTAPGGNEGHEVVALLVDLPDLNLSAGDTGAVVHCYRQGDAFEVEFLDAGGKTKAVATLSGDQILKLNWAPVATS